MSKNLICIWSCGRAANEGEKHSEGEPLFTKGQIYVYDNGYLTANNNEKIRLTPNSLKRFFKQYRAPKVNEGILFPEDDEMTRYDFISNMEHFMKQLLNNPLKARVSHYLEKHNIDNPKAIEILTKRTDPNNPESAIMIKKTRIINGAVDEEGNKGQDQFGIKYVIPRKDYNKKMRNAYINLFENYQCENDDLNEDGATSCCSVGAGDGITVPFMTATNNKKGTDVISRPFANVLEAKKKKIYITEEQMEAIREATTTFGMTPQGNAMGDITPPGCFGDKETLDHKNMIRKSAEGK